MGKVLDTVKYDTDKGYTDRNLLYSYFLKDPVAISNELTYLYGRDSDAFPLLDMTDGQKGGWLTMGADKSLGDTQYYWPIMGKMKHTSVVVGLFNTTNDSPGLNYFEFEVIFEDARFIEQWGAMAPDGSRVRIQAPPEKIGVKQYKVKMVAKTGAAINLGNFIKGKAWVMQAPTIPGQLSDGNRSHTMAPGKLKNQYGYHRFSNGITGNMGNEVVNIQFDLEGGGKTNLWMPFEMQQFELEKRKQLEEHCFYSQYNRDSEGKIHVTDRNSGGEVVPEGSGIFEMLSDAGNEDTYNELTVAKLDSTINAVFAGLSDHSIGKSKSMLEIVLYTGEGGAKAFHQALKNDASSELFYQALGDKYIKGGTDGFLRYGTYFNQYRTFRGHLITVRPSHMFDLGLKAEMEIANGDMIDGFPRDSYTMVFLDHSMVNGKRNIISVNEKGRENQIGIYKGMTTLPGAWGAIPERLLSTRKDIAWYENITSKGINMMRSNTSFVLRRAA